MIAIPRTNIFRGNIANVCGKPSNIGEKKLIGMDAASRLKLFIMSGLPTNKHSRHDNAKLVSSICIWSDYNLCTGLRQIYTGIIIGHLDLYNLTIYVFIS